VPENVIVPVVIGLAVGVSLIALFIGLPGQLSREQVWVAKNTTQCSEPWQLQETSLEGFFNDRGVRIYAIDTIRYLGEGTAVCLACSCTSGTTLYLKVDNSSVSIMTQYGFIAKTP